MVEERDGGGLEITMESRVKPYYGSSILTQARQVLETLGVKHASVAIHDEGALPFVISARIGLEQINDGFAALRRGETVRSVVVFA